jgi:hypothetical protein
LVESHSRSGSYGIEKNLLPYKESNADHSVIYKDPANKITQRNLATSKTYDTPAFVTDKVKTSNWNSLSLYEVPGEYMTLHNEEFYVPYVV